MFYPDITRYIEALENRNVCFRLLKDSVPELDKKGKIFHIAGNKSVIFKIEYNGKPYALKCFTGYLPEREKTYENIEMYFRSASSPYFPEFRYIKDEILFYDDENRCRYYPVLLMDWVQGRSLRNVLGEFAYFARRKELSGLSDIFLRFALDLLQQPYAHGDLKPDNIFIDLSGNIKLIDIDPVYTPNTYFISSHELGTPWYQHPLRDEYCFNSGMDDYSLLVLVLSLLAIEREPFLLEHYSNGENLIFTPADFTETDTPLRKHLMKEWEGIPSMQALLNLLSTPVPRIPGLYPALAKIAVERRLMKTTAAFTGIYEINICNGKYGFKDSNGNILVEPVYEDVMPFSEGYAALKSGEFWAYIDMNGDFATPFIYGKAGVFREGKAVVLQEGEWKVIDKAFKELFICRCDLLSDFSQGLAVVRKEGKYGYIDEEGNIAIPCRYDFARNFIAGKAIVRIDGKYGLIDRQGNYLLQPEYKILTIEQGEKIICEK